MRAVLAALLFLALGSGATAKRPPPLILHTTHLQGSSRAHDESWADAASGRTRTISYADGKPLMQVVSQVNGCKASEERVDYANRQWQTIANAAPFVPPGARVCSIGVDAQLYPAEIRKRLADGSLRVAGHELLGRKRVLHLREGVSGELPRIDLWVEPSTLLAVREVETSPTSTSTTLAQWLPRTAANVAKTELSVPAGFAHVQCVLRADVAPSTAQGTGRIDTKCHA